MCKSASPGTTAHPCAHQPHAPVPLANAVSRLHPAAPPVLADVEAPASSRDGTASAAAIAATTSLIACVVLLQQQHSAYADIQSVDAMSSNLSCALRS
jgi:hypothetical protein